jgi:hypothetical protein
MASRMIAVPTPALPEKGRESALAIPHYAIKQEFYTNRNAAIIVVKKISSFRLNLYLLL